MTVTGKHSARNGMLDDPPPKTQRTPWKREGTECHRPFLGRFGLYTPELTAAAILCTRHAQDWALQHSVMEGEAQKVLLLLGDSQAADSF